ncbi:MAG TPA: hypothetical protein VLA61_04540 [Ideonella sp.]|uniref:hypothetical protein n=1 Tax=Ideonella sp. TaxID=1929293 RepID=UPI002CAAE347|nr:hypothetical protein [Ideonella sp.]
MPTRAAASWVLSTGSAGAVGFPTARLALLRISGCWNSFAKSPLIKRLACVESFTWRRTTSIRGSISMFTVNAVAPDLDADFMP